MTNSNSIRKCPQKCQTSPIYPIGALLASKAAAQAVTKALWLMALMAPVDRPSMGVGVGVGIRDAKAKERAQHLGDSLSLVSTRAYEMGEMGDMSCRLKRLEGSGGNSWASKYQNQHSPALKPKNVLKR